MDPYLFRSCILLVTAVLFEMQTVSGGCIMQDQFQEASECCRQDKIFGKDVADKCYQDISARLEPHSAEFMSCFMACTYEGMGILTGDSNINVDKYLSYYPDTDPAYKSVVSKAVKTCASAADDIRRDIQHIKSSCSAFSLMFQMCASQLTINNCPDNRWTTSPICDLVKAGAQPC